MKLTLVAIAILAAVLLLYTLGIFSANTLNLQDACDANNSSKDLARDISSKIYLVDGGKKIDSGHLFASFQTLEDIGKGRVIQSMTISRQPCSIIAASSLGGKPEKLMLWRYAPSTNNAFSAQQWQKTETFGHGQDLSTQVVGLDPANKIGNQWFWIGDASGRKASRFSLGKNEGPLTILKIENYDLGNQHFENQMVSVSADAKHLIVTGRRKKSGSRKLELFVYPLPANADLQKIDGETKLTATKNWKLDASQQRKKQLRQGVASLGKSIFVLTGNSKAKYEKLLLTYDFDGRVIARQKVRVGKEDALMEGEHYEPEGLEVVQANGQYFLLIGIASGKLGARKYRVWAVKMTAKDNH